MNAQVPLTAPEISELLYGVQVEIFALNRQDRLGPQMQRRLDRLYDIQQKLAVAELNLIGGRVG